MQDKILATLSMVLPWSVRTGRGHVLPLWHQILTKIIQQKRNPLPPHLTTLLVEIKVVVFDERITQNRDLLGECSAHRSFISLFVDKIDDKLGSVVAFLCLKMPPECSLLKLWDRRIESVHWYMDNISQDQNPLRRLLTVCGSSKICNFGVYLMLLIWAQKMGMDPRVWTCDSIVKFPGMVGICVWWPWSDTTICSVSLKLETFPWASIPREK